LADFRESYPPGGAPIDQILTPGVDNNPEGWNNTSEQKIESFTIRTTEAIGNEVLVTINEDDATVSVQEEIIRRSGTIDQLSNKNIASVTVITDADTPSGSLPTEGTEFTVDVLTGLITWTLSPPDNVPIEGTKYTVEYLFRLDDAITTVVKQIKPAQRSVVIIFSNVTSLLPKAIEI